MTDRPRVGPAVTTKITHRAGAGSVKRTRDRDSDSSESGPRGPFIANGTVESKQTMILQGTAALKVACVRAGVGLSLGCETHVLSEDPVAGPRGVKLKFIGEFRASVGDVLPVHALGKTTPVSLSLCLTRAYVHVRMCRCQRPRLSL